MLSLALLVLATADVSIDLARGVPCLESAQMRSRLEGKGIAVVPTSLNRVHVGAKGTTVVLSGQSHGRTLKREVATEGEGCAAVERVVVTLISAWVKSAGIAPVAVPVKEKVEAPQVVRPKIETSSGSMHVDQSVPEAAWAFDAGLEETPIVEPDAGTAQTFPLPDPLPVGRGRVDVMVGGGVALGPSSAVGTGMAAVGFRVGLFGARVDGGFQGQRSSQVDMTTITASMQWLTLSGRITVPIHERVNLDFTVGLRGTRIDATSTGATTTSPRVLLALGGAASIAARFTLVGPLFAQLEVNGSARGQSERLFIEGTSNVLTLSPFELQTLAGLGLDFDVLRD